MTAAKRPMVLPVARPDDGIVCTRVSYSIDERIPTRLPAPDIYDREAQASRRVGHHIGHTDPAVGVPTRLCPEGHLFDIIESTVQHVIEDPEAEYGERIESTFRARLTCVKCGIVLAWEGRRTEERHVTTLDPEPLAVGDLLAQMVHTRCGGFGPAWSRYEVYRSTAAGVERVGALVPQSGLRGRRFYVGQLDAWGVGPGSYVEGKDPLATLRAIARRCKAEAAVAETAR